MLCGHDLDAEKIPQANPKLANRKDDDERLPIHWAVSYNHLPIVQLLVQSRNFDPDVTVSHLNSLQVEIDHGVRMAWAGRHS